MSLITALAATAAVAAGTAGAVTAYQLAAPEPTVAPAIESTDQGTRPDGPRFAPCKKPATLEKGTCVTAVSRTVVVEGSTLGAAAPGLPVPDDDGTPDSGDDARRDADDDVLVAVDDGEWDDDADDDWDTTGTNTGTHTSTGGSGSGTSTRTRTGG